MTAEGAEKSQQCHEQVLSLIQYICFRKSSGSNMGRQTCFLPRAPSNLVTRLHMRKNALIIVIWSEPLKIRCHVVVTQLRETVEQCACIASFATWVCRRRSGHESTASSSLHRTRTVKLALVQCECHTGKWSVIARTKLIRIEILTSDFPTFFGS